MLEDLPEELILAVASHLPATGLINLSCLSHRFIELPFEPLWRRLSMAAWQQRWPRYALSKEHERWLDQHIPSTWVARFHDIELDTKRTAITEADLASREWWFNYTQGAGGLGAETLQQVKFLGGMLHLSGYPPLPLSIEPAMDASSLTREVFG